MDTSLTIRSEKPSDIEAIHTLNEQCFPTKGEACLVDALRDARRLTISLVAVEKDERVIGHIAFSPVRTDTGEEGLGLAPVCVDKVHRRRGVGAMLVQRGVEACREVDVDGSWYLVNHHSIRALDLRKHPSLVSVVSTVRVRNSE